MGEGISQTCGEGTGRDVNIGVVGKGSGGKMKVQKFWEDRAEGNEQELKGRNRSIGEGKGSERY